MKSEKTGIGVVIPIRNERKYIYSKLINTINLFNDSAIIIVVDHNSTDGSETIVRKAIKQYGQVVYEPSPMSGKINQLRHVFKNYQLKKYVITDCDSFIEKIGTTESLVEKINGSDLLISSVLPKCDNTAAFIDNVFWKLRAKIINKIDGLNEHAYAPFYSIDWKLAKTLPEDCIADDLYYTFMASKLKVKIDHLKEDDLKVTEYRVPSTLHGLVMHKVRKADAALIEMKRFNRNKFTIFIMSLVAIDILIGLLAMKFITIMFVPIGILASLYIILHIRTYMKGTFRKKKISNISGAIISGIVIITAINFSVLLSPFKMFDSNYKRIS